MNFIVAVLLFKLSVKFVSKIMTLTMVELRRRPLVMGRGGGALELYWVGQLRQEIVEYGDSRDGLGWAAPVGDR